MDLGLKGLNALVTGGTKGIGRRARDSEAKLRGEAKLIRRAVGEDVRQIGNRKAAIDIVRFRAALRWETDRRRAGK